jgi:glycerol-3-phosphate acyltransferase PlsY
LSGWVALLAGSYLLGSISFGLIVVWILRRVDLRTLGSGNAGATNVLRTSGRWPALLVLALDIGKGIVPVRVARLLDAAPEIVAGAALAAVVGHLFPLFFGFRGGKGVATGFGALVSLYPLATGAALALFLGTVLLTRYVSLGSILAAASAPPIAALFARLGWTAPAPPVALALACATAGLVILRHAGNLQRLTAGTERRLGERKLR